MHTRFFRSGLVAALICAGLAGAATDSLAQAWPAAKPIRVLVNFPPGGAPPT